MIRFIDKHPGVNQLLLMANPTINRTPNLGHSIRLFFLHFFIQESDDSNAALETFAHQTF